LIKFAINLKCNWNVSFQIYSVSEENPCKPLLRQELVYLKMKIVL